MAKPRAVIHGYYHNIGEFDTRWELWKTKAMGLRWFKDDYPASEQMEYRLNSHLLGEKQEGAFFRLRKHASRRTLAELKTQLVAEALTGGRELPEV